MKSKQIKKSVQLTIRGVPLAVKNMFRQRASSEQRSLNIILVEALSQAAGITYTKKTHTDLDDLAGLWVNDPKFDEAIRLQDQIDSAIWQ